MFYAVGPQVRLQLHTQSWLKWLQNLECSNTVFLSCPHSTTSLQQAHFKKSWKTHPKELFFKWANPGLFFAYFWSFQTNITNFYNKYMWKKCPSSIQCRDSNTWPSDHESPPITTRPELPPYSKELWSNACSDDDRKTTIWFCYKISICTWKFQCDKTARLFGQYLVTYKQWKFCKIA